MARKNIGAKPYIMPMPVMMLSSYDENEKPTAMLAAPANAAIIEPKKANELPKNTGLLNFVSNK